MSDDEEKQNIDDRPHMAYQTPSGPFPKTQFPQYGVPTVYPEEVHPSPYPQNVLASEAWSAEDAPPSYFKDTDDSFYRCLCKTHVHKGVVAICVISIITCVIELGFEIYFAIAGDIEIYEIIWPVVVPLLTHTFLLIGNKKKKLWMYYPYLASHLFMVMGSLAITGLLIFLMVTLGTLDAASTKDDDPDGTQHNAVVLFEVVMGICVAILLIISVVQIYFFWVVSRAFLYMKRVLLNPDSTLPRV